MARLGFKMIERGLLVAVVAVDDQVIDKSGCADGRPSRQSSTRFNGTSCHFWSGTALTAI